MASISGRISSARLLKSARSHRANTVLSINHQSNEDKIDEEPTYKDVDFNQQNTNDEDIFKLLTPESVVEKTLKIKLRNQKLKEQKEKSKTTRLPTEGKLVNGEIMYDNECDIQDDLDDYGEKDPSLSEGNQLPSRLGDLPKNLLLKPLEELDPYISLREESFVVIAKRINKLYLYRFSSTKSFFIFSPFQPVRKSLVYLSTWQFFDWFMVLTILTNCIVLAIPQAQSDITEYVFTSIYTIEFIIKVIAKGFFLKPYTYLRDPWNWLDFLLLLLSYITIILSQVSTSSVNLSSLRAFRVFRAFKTVNIISGLKTIMNAIVKSLIMFLEVLMIMVFFLILFSLFALQAFQGAFTRKCVKVYDANATSMNYTDWIKNESNWQFDNSIQEYAMCCNGTTTNEGRVCQNGYICLQDIGSNPNNGLTNFDNFGYAIILNFQVISLDHWEDVYNKITDTMGQWNIFYFMPIVFLGSFYLVNLMLAVVSLAYTIESENERKKLEFVPPKKNNTVYDLETLKAKIAEKTKEKEEKLKIKEKNGPRAKTAKEKKLEEALKLEAKLRQIGVTDSLGDILEVDDNETAIISSIKLSENMGKYNNMIQEGKKSCHLHGGDLVADERNCLCCLKMGKHYLTWIKIQNVFRKIVSSLYFELFMTLCIIVNTIIMSIQYSGQPKEIDDLQDYSNYIISSIFIIESSMKIIAFGKLFFFNLSNWFDLFIILMSIIDWSTQSINGLSVFRTFRLMRIFKLAKTWKTMQKILVIIGNSVSALSYLSLVLFIVIYMFALIGLNVFADSYNKYYSPSQLPRSHFIDILHSLLMIFRVLCGECIEPLIECWAAAGPSCIALFYPTVLFGNFLILNLFMAMLLDAFDSSAIKTNEIEEDDELTKGLKRFREKISKWVDSIKNWFSKKTGSITPVPYENLDDSTTKNKLDDSKLDDSTIDEEKSLSLVDCFPKFLYAKICLCATKDTKINAYWFKFRSFFLKLIENKIFEGFIIVCILASSLMLVFEDVYMKDGSLADTILTDLDYLFQAIFFVEMIIKWIGYGFKRYFTDWWCILDFVIVMVSVINLAFLLSASGTNISFLKVLRTLRAFRPLRAISKWEGMKIVINALGHSIPAIFDVLVVCLVFWLIFCIMGVTLFKGRFYKCVDSSTGYLVDVNNKTECLSKNNTMWYNKKVNFDHVGIGYLSLLQIATFEGWRELIDAGVDVVDVDMQPKREANQWAYLYFVVFIVFGSFFTLNLFVGVIIDNFNTLKKKYEGSVMEMFLTPTQRAYIKTMRNMGKKKPQKSINRPKNKIQATIFDIVTSTKFQVAMSVIVILNLISLAFQYYKQPEFYENIFNIINTVFITIFGLEIAFKLIGMRQHFFRSIWNVFDLLVLIVCIIALPFEYYVEQFMVKPSLFYVVKLFRLIRVLRFLKAAKGIRKLIFALLISLPALFNVAALLFLIMFIYAIIGMNFFMNVKLQNGFTPTVNFQTFAKSIMLLFRVGTISGWNDVLEALMLTSSDPGSNCQDDYDLQTLPSSVDPTTANGCGNAGAAIPFMITYVLIVRMVMINMYIAIILENYDQAHEQEEIGITEDDFEHFYIVWEKYDPHATQFIRLDQLFDFVGELGPPLGVPKPNDMAITSFNLPIIKGDLIHCLDILHGLASYAIGSVEEGDEFNIIQKQIDQQFLTHFPVRFRHKPITTTMQRKKLEIAARTLQRAWKTYKLQKTVRNHTLNIITQRFVEISNLTEAS